MQKQLEMLKQLENDLIQISSTHHGRRLFLTALPFLVTACATVPKSRYREGDNKGQKTSISVSDEKKMTAEYLPSMSKDYPIIQDSELQNYIDGLGQRIIRSNGLHNNPYNYEFRVVQTKQVNAFALPAGKIFVTAPLLAMAGSEAELAGVVGHEIGHVKARHTAERIEKQKQEQTKTALMTLGGAIGGALLGRGLGKAICPPKDQECLDRITKYGALAGAAGGLLIQKYSFMANSREDEMEADRISFRTSVAAGFDKDHVGDFYTKLYEMEKQHKKGNDGVMTSLADAMSTHPPGKERVTQMQELKIKEKKNPKAVKSSKAFDDIQKRLKKFA